MKIQDLRQPDKWQHLKKTVRRYITDLIQRLRGVDVLAQFLVWPVRGIDVSYWQGEIKDPEKLASMVDFIIIRAGYGNNWIDPLIEQFRDFCKKYGKAFGLYWYVKPGKNAKEHAANFYGVWIVNPGEIYPTFDLEETGGLSKLELESWWWKMYQHKDYGFITLARIALDKVMTYTSAGFLNRAIGMTNWLKETILFIAHWTLADFPLLPNEYIKINNPKTWKFWQHSSTGKGADYGLSSRYVDQVVYNGTKGDFEKEFGVVLPSPEPPPSGEPEMKYRTMKEVSVRTGPGINNAFVRMRPVGEEFVAMNVKGDTAYPGAHWAQDQDGNWSAAQYYNPTTVFLQSFT